MNLTPSDSDMDHPSRAFFREPNTIQAIGPRVCVNAIGRVLTGYMHPLEVVFFRRAGAGAFLFVIFVSRYGVHVPCSNRPGTQIIRVLHAAFLRPGNRAVGDRVHALRGGGTCIAAAGLYIAYREKRIKMKK